MKYEEYMESLMEQIHNRRAKRLVEDEIRNHIEEQSECYEMLGMTKEEACIEAVRQMGNPVETGMALNKIHRPKMPWMLVFITLVLTVVVNFMQSVVFVEIMKQGELAAWGYIPKTICYSFLGFAIILMLLYMDYNFIAKHAYLLYAMYMIVIPFVACFVNPFSMETGIPKITEGFWNVFFGIGEELTAGSWRMGSYGILMFLPLVLAGIMYRNRMQGLKGIGKTCFFAILSIGWYVITFKFFSNTNAICLPSIMETGMIIMFMLVAAIGKGVFGSEKKKMLIVMAGGIGLCMLMIGIYFIAKYGMYSYYTARILQIFTPGEDYNAKAARDAILNSTFSGDGSFMLGNVNYETFEVFLLNGIFSYFGKIVGLLILVVLLIFLVTALKNVFSQNNRLGFLIGAACGFSILVRIISYICINFGVCLWWTTMAPFFSYGWVSAVMNGIYIGLLLCVYRNSSILKEDNIKKNIKKLRRNSVA